MLTGTDTARRTRRRWVTTAVVMVAVVAMAVVSACAPSGSQSSGSSSSSQSSSGKKSEQKTSKFVVARTADIDKLDPHVATAFQTIQTLALVYSQLVTTDAAGKIKPDLATNWKRSDGGKTVTFQLRKNVSFHNGESLTSRDVKASLNRILDESTGAAGRSNLTVIKKITTPGKYIVKLSLKKPSTALLYALSSVNSSILPAKAIKEKTIAKKPDGTGPFEWGKWKQGEEVKLTANKDYYDGAPKIQELDLRVIPSESSILSGMKSHEFQLGLLSDPSVAKRANGGSGFTLKKEPGLAYHALMLNGRHGALRNQKVRQAISCAIDRKQIIKTAAYGDGKVTGPVTSPDFTYSPTKGLPCKPGDVDKAKKLLAAGGHANGFSLTTIVETGEYATATSEAQNLKSQLAKIGVKLKLKQLSTSPYVKAWTAADFDAAVALNGGSSDPYLMYGRYWGKGGTLSKPAGMTSKTLAKLLDKGDRSSSDSQRKKIYGKLQRQLLAESPWVWTFRSDDYYLIDDSVSGFSPRADRSLITLADAAA